MKILIIILSVIGLLKLMSILLHTLILLIKNNIPKRNKKDGTVSKHFHQIKKEITCGICDWIYFIPTIRTTIFNKYFEVEIDIFVFYIYIDYSIVDIDNDES